MKTEQKRAFKPCKLPRYLVGSVTADIVTTDLKEYNNHRYKVFTAQPKVDSKPLKMNPYDYVNQRKLARDAERLRVIDLENKNLLKKISIINRTIGWVDSYNPSAYDNTSKWYSQELRMKRIEQGNKTVYQKIISANSNYSRSTLQKFWNEVLKKLAIGSKFPLVILQKPKIDAIVAKQPSISSGLEKLSTRPLCFLEFSVKGGLSLGRVLIELYHDHVPVTVQNFLSICCGEKNLTYKDSLIYRIVPGRFLETGDITLGTGRGGTSIYGKSFSEEGHKLKHTKCGVLSMVRVRQHENNSRFCITFNQYESLDHQNVVFGKIIQGLDNLMKIEGYGRKTGKPLSEIVISNCGKV